ncbi:septum formation family protein [Demequina rhizosphaerae]|uniref:septum formation family protein n=1 Tax=Demequina rhizosphaerae TaxID=1638985 RepID=UPI000785642C|nr:septum formation family protein [Demequina rhizosphaerae]
MTGDGFAPPPTLGEPRTAPAATPPAVPAPAARAHRPRRRSRLAWIVGGAAAVAIAGGVIADVALEARARTVEPAQRGDTGALASVAVVAGLCLAEAPADGPTAGRVTAVRCAEPHRAETVADHTFADGAWPGADAIAEESLAFCAARVARVVPADLAADLGWRVWAPSRETWAAGDRLAVCVVTSATPLVGSLERGDAAPA